MNTTPSALHTPLLANVAHECSTGCDLVFIENKANSGVPNWRKPKAGEKVITVGASSIHATVKGEGNTKPIKIRLERNGDRTTYSLTDAPVIKGMSGGPVYGIDDSVVGMIVGVFLPNDHLPLVSKNNHNFSIYAPYEIVLREWKLFEKKQQMVTPKN